MIHCPAKQPAPSGGGSFRPPSWRRLWRIAFQHPKAPSPPQNDCSHRWRRLNRPSEFRSLTSSQGMPKHLREEMSPSSAEIMGLREGEPVLCRWLDNRSSNQIEMQTDRQTDRFWGTVSLAHSASGNIRYFIEAGDATAGPFELKRAKRSRGCGGTVFAIRLLPTRDKSPGPAPALRLSQSTGHASKSLPKSIVQSQRQSCNSTRNRLPGLSKQPVDDY